MINNDRIVPITAIDLISMYGFIIKMTCISAGDPLGVPVVLEATTANGIFEITEVNEGNKPYLMNEPMKSCDIAAGITDTGVYFIPAYDYSGFTLNGAAVTTQGDEVTADGRTLYLANVSSGSVTITKMSY